LTTSSDPSVEGSGETVNKPRRSKLLIIPIVIVSVLVVLFVAIQFVPVTRTNPAVATPIKWDSAQTETLARQACMDCHSYETKWPWYSYVAPVSWLVYYDVQRGRSQLNFSTVGKGSSQGGGNFIGQNSNDLAYQLGQILSGGQGDRGGFPGGEGGGFPPNGQFRTPPAGAQPGQGRGFFGGGGGITNRLNEVFQNNQMPPANYLLLHPSALLTSDQRQQLLKGLLATFGSSNTSN